MASVKRDSGYMLFMPMQGASISVTVSARPEVSVK